MYFYRIIRFIFTKENSQKTYPLHHQASNDVSKLGIRSARRRAKHVAREYSTGLTESGGASTTMATAESSAQA
jgi:hypothetical protein